MYTITVFIYMGMLLIVQHEGIATPPDITSEQQHVPDSNSPIRISHLDHLVLTVTDMARTVEFYTRVLGMELITFNGGRQAVKFGKQKINLHELSKELEPKANKPTPGSADLCFITTTDLEQVSQHFKTCKVDIVEGPVERTGAMGAMTSLYIRDPDGNLIEVSNYSTSDVHLK